MGDDSRSPFRFVGLGFELVFPMILGSFLGHWLDRKLGSTPWFLLAGVLLGMAAGFLVFFRTVLPPKPPGGGAT